MKSRERIRFEKFGMLPGSLKNREGEITPQLRAEIVADLAARDDSLRGIQEGTIGHSASVRQSSNPSSGNTHPFMQMVERLKDEKSIDTESAMKEVIKKNPELHKSFLSTNKPSTDRPTQAKDPENPRDPFLQVVDQIKKEKGVPTDKAMSQAIEDNPDLYEAYMSKHQKGRLQS